MVKRRNDTKPPTQISAEQRLASLEAEVASLTATLAQSGVSQEELAAMRNDVAFLRSELVARGLGPLPNPGPRRRKLSQETVAAVRAHNAAVARAKKDVGKGMDKVATPATKQKLEAQAGLSPAKPNPKGARKR
jgi:hypothetical protein